MAKIWVQPVRGIVLMPEKQMRRMKPEGQQVEDSSYYRRLRKLGDIKIIDAPKKAAPSAAKPATVTAEKPAAPAPVAKPLEKPAEKTVVKAAP